MKYDPLIELRTALYTHQDIEPRFYRAYNEFLDHYDFTYATLFYKLLILLKKRGIMKEKVEEVLKIYEFIIFPVKKI